MLLDEGIVEEFLDYPAIFRLVIEGLTNPSVQLYIGEIDKKIIWLRITQLNIMTTKMISQYANGTIWIFFMM